MDPLQLLAALAQLLQQKEATAIPQQQVMPQPMLGSPEMPVPFPGMLPQAPLVQPLQQSLQPSPLPGILPPVVSEERPVSKPTPKAKKTAPTQKREAPEKRREPVRKGAMKAPPRVQRTQGRMDTEVQPFSKKIGQVQQGWKSLSNKLEYE